MGLRLAPVLGFSLRQPAHRVAIFSGHSTKSMPCRGLLWKASIDSRLDLQRLLRTGARPRVLVQASLPASWVILYTQPSSRLHRQAGIVNCPQRILDGYTEHTAMSSSGPAPGRSGLHFTSEPTCQAPKRNDRRRVSSSDLGSLSVI